MSRWNYRESEAFLLRPMPPGCIGYSAGRELLRVLPEAEILVVIRGPDGHR
jgi:hypothetical protein